MAIHIILVFIEAAEKAERKKEAIKWSFSERELKLIEELGRRAKR